MGKYIQWTYEMIKEYIESLGYILISKEYKNTDTKLVFKDKDGYYYEMTFYGLYNSRNKPQKFYPSNSYTIQNIKLLLIKINLDLQLVDEHYKRSSQKLTFTDSQGYYYSINLNNLISNPNTRAFDNNNPYTIYNIKLWCKLNSKPFQLISKIYGGSQQKLEWQCLKSDCKEIFLMCWTDIHQGCGCGYCHGLQVGLSNCLATLNPKLASEWHPTLNGDLTPYDVTANSGKYIWWQCSRNSEHIWNAEIKNRNNHPNCPECNNPYKGEERISKILKDKCINFFSQYKFSNCKYKRVLPFDFYLIDCCVAIEYQGIQHYEPVDYFGGEKQFKIQQKLDQIKRDYCKNNNIMLIEIPYWDFDNIEQILLKELDLNLSENKLAI